MDADFSTTTLDPDNLIAGNKPPAKAVPVTILDGEVIVRGSVLGRITASGKYALSLSAATDGSEVARAISTSAYSPSGADAEGMAYVEGEFNQDKVTFGTGKTIANSLAELQDVNVYLVDPVTATPT